MTVPVVSFDLDQLVTSRLLIQANSGGGKSHMLRYVLEQTHGRIQQIVIDPEGEFASLREKFDYILTGPEGDIPADPRSAKLLARRLMELGASAIVDIYALQKPERRRFVKIFLEEMMHLPRNLWHPVLISIDEAHNFAPEGKENESTAAVIDVCTAGRKRGMCAVLATQRISKLHKDAAAELLNKLIGRTGLDIDVKRAGDELGFDKSTRLELRDLEPGEFYAFGPAISKAVMKVRTGAITTTHPKAGQIVPPAPPPPERVKKVLGQLKDLAKQSADEARTLEEKDKEIARLKGEVRKAERTGGTTERVVEKPVVDHAAIDRAVAKAVDAERRQSQKRVTASARSLREIIRNLDRVGELITGVIVPGCQLFLTGLENGAGQNGNGAHLTVEVNPTVREEPRSVRTPARIVSGNSDSSTLPKGEHAVLTAACQYPDGVERDQITILTGYKRSTRDAYVQRLREKGLVDVRGARVVALDGAEALLGDFEPLPTGAALQDYWLEKLPEGEAAVFRVLLENHPEVVDRDVISEVTGYKRSTRDAYIQRLRTRRIIVVDGGVRAAGFLFE